MLADVVPFKILSFCSSGLFPVPLLLQMCEFVMHAEFHALHPKSDFEV